MRYEHLRTQHDFFTIFTLDKYSSWKWIIHFYLVCVGLRVVSHDTLDAQDFYYWTLYIYVELRSGSSCSRILPMSIAKRVQIVIDFIILLKCRIWPMRWKSTFSCNISDNKYRLEMFKNFINESYNWEAHYDDFERTSCKDWVWSNK